MVSFHYFCDYCLPVVYIQVYTGIFFNIVLWNGVTWDKMRCLSNYYFLHDYIKKMLHNCTHTATMLLSIFDLLSTMFP